MGIAIIFVDNGRFVLLISSGFQLLNPVSHGSHTSVCDSDLKWDSHSGFQYIVHTWLGMPKLWFVLRGTVSSDLVKHAKTLTQINKVCTWMESGWNGPTTVGVVARQTNKQTNTQTPVREFD